MLLLNTIRTQYPPLHMALMAGSDGDGMHETIEEFRMPNMDKNSSAKFYLLYSKFFAFSAFLINHQPIYPV